MQLSDLLLVCRWRVNVFIIKLLHCLLDKFYCLLSDEEMCVVQDFDHKYANPTGDHNSSHACVRQGKLIGPGPSEEEFSSAVPANSTVLCIRQQHHSFVQKADVQSLIHFTTGHVAR